MTFTYSREPRKIQSRSRCICTPIHGAIINIRHRMGIFTDGDPRTWKIVVAGTELQQKTKSLGKNRINSYKSEKRTGRNFRRKNHSTKARAFFIAKAGINH